MLKRLARLRVPLGFATGVFVLWLAAPTRSSIMLGAAVAVAGEALRVWASGHLYKSREVTSSGPYRWFAHPLYVGSGLMGAGLAIASSSVAVTALITLYLGVTLTAAINTEEAFLRGAFGDDYAAYRRAAARGGAASIVTRAFSWRQAIANREYRAVAGLLAALLLLGLKTV